MIYSSLQCQNLLEQRAAGEKVQALVVEWRVDEDQFAETGHFAEVNQPGTADGGAREIQTLEMGEFPEVSETSIGEPDGPVEGQVPRP